IPQDIASSMRPVLKQAINESFVQGFRRVMLVGAALALASGITSLLLISSDAKSFRHRLRNEDLSDASFPGKMDVDLSVDRLRALCAVRICGRGAETRATCGGCCLGRDAPGFREPGKYAGAVESVDRGRRMSQSSGRV